MLRVRDTRLLPNLLPDCCFRIYNQETVDPTVTSTETESVISSNGKIIEEECLTSKIVEDEGSIPFESYENPIKNIDYEANMQTSYDKNMQILMRVIDAVPM